MGGLMFAFNVVGACGNCGGRVIGHAGPWMSIFPPPPPKCERCGWVLADRGPVLPMAPPSPAPPVSITKSVSSTCVAGPVSDLTRCST